MFNITYETWESVCNMYFAQKEGRLKSYLQWFPFYKLSSADKATITSQQFYNTYIKHGTISLCESFFLRTDNYMQKGDGSFRDSKLLSPLMYLVLQAIGKTISEKIKLDRDQNIEVFYSGNFDEMRCYYKRDYDDFYKSINADVESYDYFIKTDIRDFFGNINLNILFDCIDKKANTKEIKITQRHLQLYKEIVSYCGDGKFPLVENSTASSYLATMVYLDNIDVGLYDFINNKIDEITDFKMIRYVDDLYILIRSEKKLKGLIRTCNEIINEYSSLLKEHNLALNTKKVCVKQIDEINEELKKSLYDEYVNGIRCEIAELCPSGMKLFLQQIEQALKVDDITVEQYNQTIENAFSIEGTEFTPAEVYNYFVYEDTSALEEDKAIEMILKIIRHDISFICLDPKRLTLIIMKTKSDIAIRALLNKLFQHNRAGKWNSYDTTIAISYLIQSQFRHIDLLDVIYQHNRSLYKYYYYFCRQSFMSIFNHKTPIAVDKIVSADEKVYYLYCMYFIEESRGNHLTAYAYYKNFFDRLSAHFAFYSGFDKGNGKVPNYKGFYSEGALKKLYSGLTDSDSVIRQAHKIRNSNPLSHASAELVDNNNSTAELQQTIEGLQKLISEYMQQNRLM
jgi:AbiA family abortive infection protein